MERGGGVEVGRSRHGSGGGGCRECGKENRWWKTVGYRARSRDQVRSGADGGGARCNRLALPALDVVEPPLRLFAERNTASLLHNVIEIVHSVGSARRDDFTGAAFPLRFG